MCFYNFFYNFSLKIKYNDRLEEGGLGILKFNEVVKCLDYNFFFF